MARAGDRAWHGPGAGNRRSDPTRARTSALRTRTRRHLVATWRKPCAQNQDGGRRYSAASRAGKRPYCLAKEELCEPQWLLCKVAVAQTVLPSGYARVLQLT